MILGIIEGGQVKIKVIRTPGQQQKKVMSPGVPGGGGWGQKNLTGAYEDKKIAFREDLFSLIKCFRNFREDLFSRIDIFQNFAWINFRVT